MTGTPIRNVIFDLDGTLVDSKRDIARAQLWMLRQFGIDRFTEEDIYPRIGRPLTATLPELFPPELHHRIPEAVEMYVQYYRPRALETTVLFPGVREMLEELIRSGIRLALATTKSTATSLRVLQHFGIDQLFAQVQGTDGTPAKPDPFILNKILQDQRWNGAESLMAGDTEADILAGRNAGLRTCAFTHGSLSRVQLLPHRPDFIVDTPAELTAITRG